MENVQDNRLLKEKDVATLLACSTSLLRKLRRLGKGPTSLKLGDLVRYPSRELDLFIASLVSGPQAA